MSTSALKLIADTGLFVLTWLVQLVIYPSFLYMDDEALLDWHSVYTQRITYVVMPLMLLQIWLYGKVVFQNPTWHSLFPFCLILAIWCLTFLWAIPLHHELDRCSACGLIARQLITAHWPRTLLWSALFGLTLYHNLISKNAK